MSTTTSPRPVRRSRRARAAGLDPALAARSETTARRAAATLAAATEDGLGEQIELPLGIELPRVVEPDTTSPAARRLTIDERAAAWLDLNPWVIDYLEARVQEWLDAGHRRIGIGAVWEVLRWDYGRTHGDEFKANNDYRSRVARILLNRRPEWAEDGVILTRKLRTP